MADKARGESDQEEKDRQDAERAEAREAHLAKTNTVTDGPERISSTEETQRQIDEAKAKRTIG